MHQLGLRWSLVWDEGRRRARVTAAQNGLLKWQGQEEPELVLWPGFINSLRALEPEKWYDLYLSGYTDKSEAITAGIHLAEPVTNVYRALLPLYKASTP